MTQVRLSIADLRDAIALILTASGASSINAALVAEQLVEAQAMGHASHGVRLVDKYVDRLQSGQIDGEAQPLISDDLGSIVHIDGNRAFGQVVGDFAAALGVDRVKRNGVCVISVSNARHFGRNGRWAEKAAREGVASIHFVHGFSTEPSVVPYGSVERKLGTTPIAIGAPSSDGGLILDFSIAEISANTVRQFHERGERLPTPALMGQNGVTTNDPGAFVAGTAGLIPFGGFKGYGLAVLAQVFAAGIGAHGRFDNGSNSMLSIYLNVEHIIEPGVYHSYVHSLIGDLRAAAVIPGGPGVVSPGDRSRANYSRHQKEGIELDLSERNLIIKAASKVGITQQLTSRWPAAFIQTPQPS